jgi:hypothetical protein
MIPSTEQLVAIARTYFRPDKDYDFTFENSPEADRFQARWAQEIKKMDRWGDFLRALGQELPYFRIRNATATSDSCFRCSAYVVDDNPRPPLRWAVVGCLSILAPVYTIYGVQFEYTVGEPTERIRDTVFFEPLPPEMRVPADVIARRIEATFEVSRLPREVAEIPIPLIVEPQEPPEARLFHALFTSRPECVP